MSWKVSPCECLVDVLEWTEHEGGHKCQMVGKTGWTMIDFSQASGIEYDEPEELVGKRINVWTQNVYMLIAEHAELKATDIDQNNQNKD